MRTPGSGLGQADKGAALVHHLPAFRDVEVETCSILGRRRDGAFQARRQPRRLGDLWDSALRAPQVRAACRAGPIGGIIGYGRPPAEDHVRPDAHGRFRGLRNGFSGGCRLLCYRHWHLGQVATVTDSESIATSWFVELWRIDSAQPARPAWRQHSL
jgi:hypothetical protein